MGMGFDLLKKTILIILGCHSQVQAVLLLLGGREVPPTMPAMPISPHQNNQVLLLFGSIFD